MKDEGKSRHDLGRELFLKRVWDWKTEYETRIHHQFRKVGCSVDWERAYFSMDDQCTRATVAAFTQLFDEGLIYRATRMINWSCKLKTAISDIEVDYLDLEGRTKMAVPGHAPDRKYEFGVLTSFGYPVEDSDEHLIVATTRYCLSINIMSTYIYISQTCCLGLYVRITWRILIGQNWKTKHQTHSDRGPIGHGRIIRILICTHDDVVSGFPRLVVYVFSSSLSLSCCMYGKEENKRFDRNDRPGME